MNAVREKNVQLSDLMPLIREQLAAGKTVRFAPRGTSMLPMLRQGKDQVILAAPPQKLKKYDLPLYQRESGQYVLHRIIRVDESTEGVSYTCMGDNQFWPEPGVRPEQIIAVVTAFQRGEKLIDIKAPTYRIYCRLWQYSRWPRRLAVAVIRRLTAAMNGSGRLGKAGKKLHNKLQEKLNK